MTMLPRFLRRLTVNSLHATDRAYRRIRLIVVLSFTSPVILFALLSYVRADRDLTNLTLSRRGSVADLGASMLAEKFDRLVDIGTSLATRRQFRRLIANGRWSEAVDILESVPKDFPFIERVFLADAGGTLMADVPALPGVLGKNFAFRDWYQGVSSKWEPYVSDVYERAAPPQYNVVAIAVPIRSETETIIGILVLQVRLETLTEWTKHIGLGPTGFLYVVDRKGNLAVHPKFSPEGDLVDFSRVPTVQKVLRGERGVEILFNPVENEQRLSAYAPVPRYGWGLVALEATETAFELRNKGLTFLLAVFTLMFLLSCFLSYLIIRAFAERRRSEVEIKKLNEDLRRRGAAILESALDCIIVIDRDGRITEFNPAAEQTFGYARAEVIGKEMAEMIMPERYRAKHRSGIAHYLATGEGPVLRQQIEITALRRDGKEFPVELAITPINSGETVTFCGFLRDITKRKQAQEAIKQLNEQLERRVIERTAQLEAVNRELEAFSYSVSHDLRAPLRHVNGYVELLRKHLATGLDAKGQRYMDTIGDSARQMGRLVDDLLVFSRMGRAEMNVSEVSMQRVVDEAQERLRSQTTGRDIDWKIGSLPEVQGDPAMLRQVWLNLIDNAVKYTRTRERAEIEVGSVFNGEESVFFVRDNGVGFDPRYAGKLFGVFERLHRSDEFEGTGIGLANVRRIIQRHGGRTWAEGQVEGGATFYFSLLKVRGGEA